MIRDVHKELFRLDRERGGEGPMSDEERAFRLKWRWLPSSIYLQIEAFYLFARILLDHVARSHDTYFGKGRKASLNSHDDLVKNLHKFVDEKNLVWREEFCKSAERLKRDIADYRDYYIAHEQSSSMRRGLMYDGSTEGQVSFGSCIQMSRPRTWRRRGLQPC